MFKVEPYNMVVDQRTSNIIEAKYNKYNKYNYRRVDEIFTDKIIIFEGEGFKLYRTIFTIKSSSNKPQTKLIGLKYRNVEDVTEYDKDIYINNLDYKVVRFILYHSNEVDIGKLTIINYSDNESYYSNSEYFVLFSSVFNLTNVIIDSDLKPGLQLVDVENESKYYFVNGRCNNVEFNGELIPGIESVNIYKYSKNNNVIVKIRKITKYVEDHLTNNYTDNNGLIHSAYNEVDSKYLLISSSPLDVDILDIFHNPETYKEQHISDTVIKAYIENNKLNNIIIDNEFVFAVTIYKHNTPKELISFIDSVGSDTVFKDQNIPSNIKFYTKGEAKGKYRFISFSEDNDFKGERFTYIAYERDGSVKMKYVNGYTLYKGDLLELQMDSFRPPEYIFGL